MFFDVAESPMIAFINSRSGGRAGPQLLTTLHQALGNAQVQFFDGNKEIQLNG